MLSISEKNQYRSELFRHLDGIGIAPVAYALKEKDILDYILKEQKVSLEQVCNFFHANEGYLNVGLRLLASQGWLDHSVDNDEDAITIYTNKNSAIAFRLFDRYKDISALLKISEEFHPRLLEEGQFSAINKIFNQYKNGDFDAVSEDKTEQALEAQIKLHIEGALIGPITVFLGMDGMFHKYFMEASFSADEFHEDPINFSKILDFL
ncbi:MAG: hypothetical protein ACI836_000069, partial [Saprospiraceae bacterium]